MFLRALPKDLTALELMLLAAARNAAGSGVSELLDDRLRKLKLELKASEKACQALLPSVEAFTKGTREVRSVLRRRAYL